ncbi:MAG: prepilin-type N-terminal cleavage/methylation domain-containing protein [Firmicutes bacterium]|nr:prepilin-type N-terminal cleavage/methylation domain-containing protein [Bacillota bacterium]
MSTVRGAAEDGFSLVELLISLGIIGLLLGSIYGCYFSGIRSWQQGIARMDHQQNSRIALDKIVRELHYASYVEVLGGGEEIYFRFNGDRKSYYFRRVGPERDDLVMIHRQAGGSTSQTKIALEITALTFAVDEENRVSISLTSGAGPESITIRSSVRPRNIP